MSHIFDREHHLRERLNKFLEKELCLPANDYYSNLDAEQFLNLKSVLSDINNIFTLKVSLAFANWISDILELDSEVKEKITSKVLTAKPSANGYDIEVSDPVKIIAEVKCNVPINGGTVYGAAQKNGIQKDINALINGKSKSQINPENYLKFMVFLNLSEIKSATDNFIKNMKSNKDKIVIIDTNSRIHHTDKIYVVYLNI